MKSDTTVSPLLANIYLHYVFDLWVQRWRQEHAHGHIVVVRYADDFIVGFQHREDADQFLGELRERLAKFKLELHPDKTRLIEFGRYAAERRRERGLGGTGKFDFLGVTHACGKTKKGGFLLLRHTMGKRLRAKLKEVRDTLRRRRHQPIPEQGAWLAGVLRGYYAYHAVPTNTCALEAFRTQVTRHWHHALRRRSQRDRTNWARMDKLASRWLPRPRIVHPWPEVRFDRHHPR